MADQEHQDTRKSPLPRLDKSKSNIQEFIDETIHGDSVPRFYANHTVNLLTQSDAAIIFRQYDQALVSVQMSFTALKSLHQSIGDLILKFEEDTGQTIMTSDFIEKKRVVGERKRNQGKRKRNGESKKPSARNGK